MPLTREAAPEVLTFYGQQCRPFHLVRQGSGRRHLVSQGDTWGTWGAEAAQATFAKRNGELRDLRGTAVFLASRASDYVTGQAIFVDGGFSAG